MSDFGVIYFVDGLKNLYRKDVDLSLPIWNGLNSFQILHNRLSQLKTAGSVLLLPQPLGDVFVNFIAKTDTRIIEYNPSEILEKPYGLNQQHWFLEDSSGNDSWYGKAFVDAFEKNPYWKAAVLVPLTNLLIDANDVAESLELYQREGFEICFAEERVPGAEWAIFNSELIRGLYKSNPEVMTTRGALYWAARKPLYPFKVGAYHCPRIRPALSANLRLNSLRALKTYQSAASENFASPDFSYGDFLMNSGWEKAYADYAPLQINIEPSSFCNAHCEGCPNPGLKREKSFLKLDAFERIIAGIDDKDQRLVFSGVGEPLLNGDLAEMLKMASGFNVTVQTSLQVLPKKDFPFEAVDHIRISIDSDTQKGFERLRPGCSWQNIEEFIEKASECKATYETIFPEIGLDYLRRGSSEKDILPFMKKWRAVCEPVFKGNFFRWPFNLKPNRINWYQISGEAAYCGLTENTSTVSFEPFKRRPCRNAVLSITILSDGTVTGCPYDAEGNNFKLGSLSENSLMEIWNSEAASVWRSKHLKKEFSGYCSNCHDWYRA